MKKISAIVLIICMVFLSLVGCENPFYGTTSTATTHAETEPVSSNPLIAAELHRWPVRNGSDTETIGVYAYIRISKSELKSITMEEYKEFCENVVFKVYNWVSIICDDGTGIQFPGAQYTFATYGTINYQGVIIDEIGTIWKTENGFEYRK